MLFVSLTRGFSVESILCAFNTLDFGIHYYALCFVNSQMANSILDIYRIEIMKGCIYGLNFFAFASAMTRIVCVCCVVNHRDNREVA